MRGPSRWNALRRGIASVLLGLVIAYGGWIGFTAWSISEPPPGGWPGDQAALYQRYADARDAVRSEPIIGYRGAPDPMGNPAFLIARLALFPTVVSPGADASLVLVDEWSVDAQDRALAGISPERVVWRSSSGVAVIRVGETP